jgi:pyridoxal phosphate-dependent aminotransferase EpsN
MPEPAYCRSNRWLTVIVVDPQKFGSDRESIRLKLEEHNIESRPIWKPMHMQPVFQNMKSYGGDVARRLFEEGLCLPSGSQLTGQDLDRIAGIVKAMASAAA